MSLDVCLYKSNLAKTWVTLCLNTQILVPWCSGLARISLKPSSREFQGLATLGNKGLKNGLHEAPGRETAIFHLFLPCCWDGLKPESLDPTVPNLAEGQVH